MLLQPLICRISIIYTCELAELQHIILNSTDVFLLWYFHLHVLARNPDIFRVIFLSREYSLVKRVKLLHNIEINVIIGWNFP